MLIAFAFIVAKYKRMFKSSLGYRRFFRQEVQLVTFHLR